MTSPARQNDPDLCEPSELRLDLYGATVLFDDDIVAYRETKAGSAFTPMAFVVKNGLNIFAFTSAGMPVPLSRMRISTKLPRFFVLAP